MHLTQTQAGESPLTPGRVCPWFVVWTAVSSAPGRLLRQGLLDKHGPSSDYKLGLPGAPLHNGLFVFLHCSGLHKSTLRNPRMPGVDGTSPASDAASTLTQHLCPQSQVGLGLALAPATSIVTYTGGHTS